MVKKVIMLGVIIAVCLSVLSGCNGISKYNAVLYDDVGELLYDEFIGENLTGGAFFEGIYLDKNLYPSIITSLIKNKDELDSIFTNFPVHIDFEKEMIALYAFTSENGKTIPYELVSVKIKEGVLSVKCKFISSPKAKTGARPWQRWFAVKMDRIEIKNIEFVLI